MNIGPYLTVGRPEVRQITGQMRFEALTAIIVMLLLKSWVLQVNDDVLEKYAVSIFRGREVEGLYST
jgi:hypothetical protein